MKFPFVIRLLSIFLVSFFSIITVQVYGLENGANESNILPPEPVNDANAAAVDSLGAPLEGLTRKQIEASLSKQLELCGLDAGMSGSAMKMSCLSCAKRAAEVCSDPSGYAQSSGLTGMIQQVVQNAPALATLASTVGGEKMAQMQCYASAIGALGVMMGSQTVAKICKQWRDGGDRGVPGCRTTCSTAYNTLVGEAKAAGDLTQSQSDLYTKSLSSIDKAVESCTKATSEGEQGTLAQSLQAATQMAQAKSCMDSLDSSFAGETLVDCDLPQYKTHQNCEVLNNEKLGSYDGDLLTNADLAGGELNTEADPFIESNPADFTPDNQGKAGGGAGAGIGAGGGFGGGGGSAASAAEEKERGGGRAKAKAFGGYRNAASAGGSGAGRGGRKKFGRFNKFKLAKDNKNKKDSDSLKALAAFAKAGIVPDTEGFIFERITNRFSATCNPKQFFDCTRNKVSWYEQNKFKKK